MNAYVRAVTRLVPWIDLLAHGHGFGVVAVRAAVSYRLRIFHSVLLHGARVPKPCQHRPKASLEAKPLQLSSS